MSVWTNLGNKKTTAGTVARKIKVYTTKEEEI